MRHMEPELLTDTVEFWVVPIVVDLGLAESKE